MKFDWYQATVEQPPAYLRGALSEGAPGSVWEEVSPVQKAARAHQLFIGGQVGLTMLEGGRYAHPHLVASGGVADDSASLLRSVAPAHLVSRADVCEDLEAPGWFDRAFQVCVDLARAERVKPMRMGDWDSDEVERTLYLGSPSSDVRTRLYEKGKEQRAKCPQAADMFSPDWVRLEVQVRPSKREAKMAMAARPAADFWGCAAWTRKLSAQLLDVEAPRVRIGSVWNPSADLERAEHHLMLQWRSVMARRAALEGSYEAMGAYYERLAAQYDERAANRL